MVSLHRRPQPRPEFIGSVRLRKSVSIELNTPTPKAFQCPILVEPNTKVHHPGAPFNAAKNARFPFPESSDCLCTSLFLWRPSAGRAGFSNPSTAVLPDTVCPTRGRKQAPTPRDLPCPPRRRGRDLRGDLPPEERPLNRLLTEGISRYPRHGSGQRCPPSKGRVDPWVGPNCPGVTEPRGECQDRPSCGQYLYSRQRRPSSLTYPDPEPTEACFSRLTREGPWGRKNDGCRDRRRTRNQAGFCRWCSPWFMSDPKPVDR